MEQNYEQAVYWYAKSAAQGYSRAQYNLGICYEKGQGVEQDLNLAVSFYIAAGQGNTNALAALNRLNELLNE